MADTKTCTRCGATKPLETGLPVPGQPHPRQTPLAVRMPHLPQRRETRPDTALQDRRGSEGPAPHPGGVAGLVPSRLPRRLNNPILEGGALMELVDLFSDMRDRPVWQDDGLCAEVDPELWFPEKGISWREAKALCLRCPVREQCLAFALERPERFGVWGGLSVREREAKARQLKDAAKIDQNGTAA